VWLLDIPTENATKLSNLVKLLGLGDKLLSNAVIEERGIDKNDKKKMNSGEENEGREGQREEGVGEEDYGEQDDGYVEMLRHKVPYLLRYV
jgi:hypothetical protein